MTDAAAALWIQLRDAGLVNGEPPAPSRAASPWYVRLMLGVAGWIAALFLLGFVSAGLAFVFRSSGAALVVGLLCCSAALAIFKAARGNDLATQIGLAVSVAGQLMFIYGLAEAQPHQGPSTALFVEVAVFETVLAVFGDNFVSRVITAYGAALAGRWALISMGVVIADSAIALAVAVLWMSEGRWASRGSFWRAIGYGLTFSLLEPFSPFLFEMGPALPQWIVPLVSQPWWPWFYATLMAGVVAYVATRALALRAGDGRNRALVVSVVGSVAVVLAARHAPGCASALVVLLCGLARGNRSLIGLGAIGLVGYLSYYYYSLEATLLIKSYALLGLGATLLILWGLVQWLFPEPMASETVRA